jgi:NAD(P)-dependent dehydrogenase (short-subunit alcohol dehydrogenase family)
MPAAVSPQIIIVTGASSGFGALAARHLALEGHTVYAGFRKPDDGKAPEYGVAKQWSKENKRDLRPINLDVVNDASIKKAIDAIMATGGRIDVIVHNAGHMVWAPPRPHPQAVCRAVRDQLRGLPPSKPRRAPAHA